MERQARGRGKGKRKHQHSNQSWQWFSKNFLDAIISGTRTDSFLGGRGGQGLTCNSVAVLQSWSTSVDQVGLELRDLLDFVSQGLGLKTFTNTHGLGKQDLMCIWIYRIYANWKLTEAVRWNMSGATNLSIQSQWAPIMSSALGQHL